MSSKRVDDRVRRNRIEVRTKDWTDQMERLVDAYLHYQMYVDEEDRAVPPPPTDSSGMIGIEVVDVFCKFFARPSSKY